MLYPGTGLGSGVRDCKGDGLEENKGLEGDKGLEGKKRFAGQRKGRIGEKATQR